MTLEEAVKWLRYGLEVNPLGYSPHWDAIRAALEEIEWQARRIAELEKDVPTATQKVWRAEANRQSHRAEAAEAREAKLREALRHYGTHRLPGCHYAMAKTCQCGLADTLAEEDASDRRMRQEVDR